MKDVTIPPKDRQEWKQIVIGEIDHKYRNYVLQMKAHQANKDVASNKLSVDEAVSELYDICDKYAMAVQIDFKDIFKTW
jgi:hypothetical protein